jgi:hypothetical protein
MDTRAAQSRRRALDDGRVPARAAAPQGRDAVRSSSGLRTDFAAVRLQLLPPLATALSPGASIPILSTATTKISSGGHPYGKDPRPPPHPHATVGASPSPNSRSSLPSEVARAFQRRGTTLVPRFCLAAPHGSLSVV